MFRTPKILGGEIGDGKNTKSLKIFILVIAHSLSIYCVLLSNLRTTLYSRYYYYFHFTDGKNEAYRSEVTYTRMCPASKWETKI